MKTTQWVKAIAATLALYSAVGSAQVNQSLNVTWETYLGGAQVSGPLSSTNYLGLGSYSFANTYSLVNGGTPIAGSQNDSFGQTFGFMDDYVINIPASQLRSDAITVNIPGFEGLSFLGEQLYALGSPPNSPPTFTPAPIAVGSSTNTSYGISTTIPLTSLPGGNYVLEIVGTVNALDGGSYGGTLDIAPYTVPLPGALMLMLSSLGLLPLFRRRRHG